MIGVVWAMVPSMMPLMRSFEPNGIALLQEWAFGCCLGALGAVCLHALNLMGEGLSHLMGLSNVVTHHQNTSSTLLSDLLQRYGLVLFWASDMHHHGLRAFYRSYHAFPVGTFGLLASHQSWAFESLMGLAAQTTLIILGCIAPFWLSQLAIQITLGVISRLMPGLPVFLISQPLEILIGFFFLWFCFETLSALLLQTLTLWM